jgi:HAD superfamily phosphoserine phosphatase-like hydrolase
MAEYMNEKRNTHKQWYKEWCDRSAVLFKKKKLKRSDFALITETVKPVEGLRETLETLKANGLKLAIVSGGIDVFLKEKIPDYEQLFDYVYINKFRFDEEGLFEGVAATRYDFEGKVIALEEVCKKEGFAMEQVVFVGDGFNDAHILGQVGRTIAFVPSSAEMINADITIKDPDLRRILPYVLNESQSGQRTSAVDIPPRID